jgi:hypothetical protein
MFVKKGKGYVRHFLSREKGARQNVSHMMPPSSFTTLKETLQTVIVGEKFTCDHSTCGDVHASPRGCHKHNYSIFWNLV